MDAEDRGLLLTAAWLFARHGQGARARTLCEALVEDDPRDGVSAAALATRQLADGNAAAALATLRAAEMPASLAREAALLETRALASLGKKDEAERCWRRYVESSRGTPRRWIS